MTGAYAERLRWNAFLVFTIAWEILVYYPLVHWIWGGGFLHTLGVLDFAVLLAPRSSRSSRATGIEANRGRARARGRARDRGAGPRRAWSP